MKSTRRSSAASAKDEDRRIAKILSGKYLQSTKKDLVARLRRVLQVLREADEDLEPHSSLCPDLDTLSHSLPPFLEHQQDKQVRLYTVSICMELFTIYAADAPWNPNEILDIFRQTIRQLANLAHTTSPQNTHFADYMRILELLAQVKIGVILVEMTKEEQHQQEALPVLAVLFRTLLQSVRVEHPPQVAEMIQQTICGCLEEFHDGIMLPTPLLDELLLCIGQGPKVLVIDPVKAAAKSKRHKSQKVDHPHHVEQTNPSYIVASSILRHSVDRLSTPVAALLNGLLNHDARLTSESILSTKLVKDLSKPQTQGQDAQADVFNVVLELHRVSPTILTTVVGTLTNFLAVPEVDQRKLIVQLLGKLFVKSTSTFATKYRVCFRQWLERAQDKDANIRSIMVQYLLQLVPVELQDISLEAQAKLLTCLDDPSLEVRLQTIHGICDLAYKDPSWIALDTWLAIGHRVTSKHKQERKDALTGLVQTYFKHYMAKNLQEIQSEGDDAPLELIQRVLETSDDERFGWIPTRLFECASLQDDTDLQARIWQAMDDMLLGSELPHSSKRLTATARAVGLALVVDHLQENASRWLGGLLRQRAKVQHKVQDYMKARLAISEFAVGSEDALKAHANAKERLEQLADLIDFPSDSGVVLERFHAAKDKHIFRILGGIADPSHTLEKRLKALEELPKRVKSQGDGSVAFVKRLIRRCAMGDFLNADIIYHSTLLAQECANHDDWQNCQRFLKCVELAVQHFPNLGSSQRTFQNLMELFGDVQDETIVTSLSGILARSAPRTQTVEQAAKLQEDLLKWCTTGQAQQARNAARTFLALAQNDESLPKEVLLKRLTAALAKRKSLVSIFGALAECASSEPTLMSGSRGQKAVTFALDTILLGKEEESGRFDESRRRSRSSDAFSSWDDEALSLTCRVHCAAIEFLVSHIRASIFASRRPTASVRLEEGLLEQVFGVLSQILRDKGLPAAAMDQAFCKLQQDRAALRQCAAVHLLRLCDPRLGLDQRFLTLARWKTLSTVFVDDERVVRDKVMEEFGLLLTGNGVYGAGTQAMIPSFNLVSLIVLCVDGDHGVDGSVANGYAANVGRRATTTKKNASSFTSSLRKIFEVESARARASGEQEWARFEKRMKVRLMPEYIVPYAYYLLALRNETPSQSPSDASSGTPSKDHLASKGRILRRRLKWLFDPIVLTLGDDGGNLSFLLCLSEKLMKVEPIEDASVDSTDAVDRLRVVCATAREVLLSYVKKDTSLAAFPGQIHFPGSLFRKPRVARKRKDSGGTVDTDRRVEKVARKKKSSIEIGLAQKSALSPSQQMSTQSDGPLSPALSHIETMESPGAPSGTILRASGEMTRGSTPPSALRDTVFTQTEESVKHSGSSAPISPSSTSPRKGRNTRPRRKPFTDVRRESSTNVERKESGGKRKGSSVITDNDSRTTMSNSTVPSHISVKQTGKQSAEKRTRKSLSDSPAIDDGKENLGSKRRRSARLSK